jgi:hypothetical protein
MNEPDLTGWYAGLVVGAAAIFAIVVLVAMILELARTLGAKSTDVALALRQARRNTDSMPDVATINVGTHRINTVLIDLRRNLNAIFPEASQ